MGSTTQYHGTKSYLRFPLDMDLHTPISATPVPQFPNISPLPALPLPPNSISPVPVTGSAGGTRRRTWSESRWSIKRGV